VSVCTGDPGEFRSVRLCLSVSLSACLPVCLSVCLCICLSAYLLSVCGFVCKLKYTTPPPPPTTKSEATRLPTGTTSCQHAPTMQPISRNRHTKATPASNLAYLCTADRAGGLCSCSTRTALQRIKTHMACLGCILSLHVLPHNLKGSHNARPFTSNNSTHTRPPRSRRPLLLRQGSRLVHESLSRQYRRSRTATGQTTRTPLNATDHVKNFNEPPPYSVRGVLDPYPSTALCAFSLCSLSFSLSLSLSRSLALSLLLAPCSDLFRLRVR
jgi:hypothetical protein